MQSLYSFNLDYLYFKLKLLLLHTLNRMKHQFKLEEQDYHTHLLFTVSRSSSAIKMRNRVRYLISISMLIFSIIAFGNGSVGQGLYFIFLMLISFTLMPLYTRWSYKKTYLKHVRKYYKERMSEPTSVEITPNHLMVKDSQGESLIPFSDLDTINELKEYIFLKLDNGTSIIFPIEKIAKKSQLIEELKKLSEKENISWVDETNWVWK